jgi:adenylate cyclase
MDGRIKNFSNDDASSFGKVLLNAEKKALIQSFEDGWKCYSKGQFTEALTRFDQCLEIALDDGPALSYKKSCEMYLTTPPADDWAGEWT